MDAYDIQQQIRAIWETVAKPASGTTLSKIFPETPVYVLVEGKLVTVQEVYLDSGKIILKAK